MTVTIKRNFCCICESEDLTFFMELKSFPILMGTTLKPSEGDKFVDQKWVVCQKCGCLQLIDLIPLEVLYSEQHSAGAVGVIWQEHHRAFSKFILVDHPSNICEIGAAHGVLASNILNLKSDIDYLVIEPSPMNMPKGVRVIQGFVEDNLSEVYSYKNVVHSHVLEHIYSPTQFLANLANGMEKHSFMYMSIPNIQRLIETGGTNSLNFEHTYYLHPAQLKSVLGKLGLFVLRESMYKGHSYFFKIGKVGKGDKFLETKILNIAHLADEFSRMWAELKDFTAVANQRILSDSIPTYLFGAHVFSQALISLGLNTSEITGVIDNSEEKQGQRLYGSNFQVFSPKVIEGNREIRVILKASHYQEEIRNQLLELNPHVQIIE